MQIFISSCVNVCFSHSDRKWWHERHLITAVSWSIYNLEDSSEQDGTRSAAVNSPGAKSTNSELKCWWTRTSQWLWNTRKSQSYVKFFKSDNNGLKWRLCKKDCWHWEIYFGKTFFFHQSKKSNYKLKEAYVLKSNTHTNTKCSWMDLHNNPSCVCPSYHYLGHVFHKPITA